MAKYTTLTALFAAIANALRSKTGGTGTIVADDFPSVIDSLSTGGITPTGTKTITANGTYDVTSFSTASVNVPASGITPSGTKTITENGTHDVTNFTNALVNVAGLNARVFTSTVSEDATSGTKTISGANDFIASIRDNPDAFIFVRLMDVPKATAALTAWFHTNAALAWRASSNSYRAISVRQSATYEAVTLNVYGLTGTNYNGHISVTANGSVQCAPNTTYPLKAGTYQIIAGILEAL